jgi:hypothetical protein
MIAKAIIAHFNCSDLDTLIKRNSKFIQWTDATSRSIANKIDGPSLLKAILDKLMPGTVGQIDALRQKAKDIKLTTYGNDVNNILLNLSVLKVKSMISEGLLTNTLVYVFQHCYLDLIKLLIT